MPKATKEKLFEHVLELEHLAEKKVFDYCNYSEQADGAFSMLKILGLDKEYIRWSYMK